MSQPVRFLHCHRGAYLKFDYVNWRGENSTRRVRVGSIFWGRSEWHHKVCWLLSAFDVDKHAWRSFSMSDMSNVEAITDDRQLIASVTTPPHTTPPQLPRDEVLWPGRPTIR